MVTVTGLTASRMLAIENQAIVSADIVDGELIFTRFDGGLVNVGSVAGPTGPPSLIGFKKYDPDPIASIEASLQTLVDVDATNLVVPFNAPASGKVLVELSALASVNTNAVYCEWGLREGASVVGIAQPVVGSGNVTDDPVLPLGARATAHFYISGLTPGAAHSYKWAHAASNISAGRLAHTIYGTQSGASFGPAIMKVLAMD